MGDKDIEEKVLEILHAIDAPVNPDVIAEQKRVKATKS